MVAAIEKQDAALRVSLEFMTPDTLEEKLTAMTLESIALAQERAAIDERLEQLHHMAVVIHDMMNIG